MLDDVPQIIPHHFRLVGKELTFCLEMAQLKNQMDRRRLRMHGGHGVAFDWAQIEIEAALFLGETRQAVQFVDLPGGQNREPTGIGSQAMPAFRNSQEDGNKNKLKTVCHSRVYRNQT